MDRNIVNFFERKKDFSPEEINQIQILKEKQAALNKKIKLYEVNNVNLPDKVKAEIINADCALLRLSLSKWTQKEIEDFSTNYLQWQNNIAAEMESWEQQIPADSVQAVFYICEYEMNTAVYMLNFQNPNHIKECINHAQYAGDKCIEVYHYLKNIYDISFGDLLFPPAQMKNASYEQACVLLYYTFYILRESLKKAVENPKNTDVVKIVADAFATIPCLWGRFVQLL